MLDLLRHYQLDIMLVLSGVCLVISFFVLISRTISPSRKRALFTMEFGSGLLLLSDRCAYLYQGDPSTLGFWMVRISNFLVFFLLLVIICGFNEYIADVYVHEGGYERPPRRLARSRMLLVAAMALVVVSQFTGLYYTFDETNTYQRAPGLVVCYALPFIVLFLQLSVVIANRRRIRRRVLYPLVTFAILPLVASIVQIFAYGVSLTNITLPLMAVLLYVLVLNDLTAEAVRARRLEVAFLKAEQLEARMMFDQTATALANAIDAKDAYTRGHSMRVAQYARHIAMMAGKSEEFCDEVYYAGLLHDVGKIGIPGNIINKEGRLSEEEFAIIRTHPVQGDHILRDITRSPYLRIGARHHLERYDGRGYPDGLAGEDIPELARIIAVADAYDAMTSKRSYRDTMPQAAVRAQVEQGLGTQFDPVFGQIMLDLIDEDTEYRMREHDDED